MRFIRVHICRFIGLVVLLILSFLSAQETLAQSTTDSLFLANSRAIIFTASSNELRPADEVWVADSLIPELKSYGPNSIILGRSAASPDGSLSGNSRLAHARREAAIRFFQLKGFDASRIRFDVVDEEYALLVEMMRQRHDPYYAQVRDIVERCGDDLVSIKSQLMAIDRGALWTRFRAEYFPNLRAVRIMAFDAMPSFAIRSLIADAGATGTYPIVTVPSHHITLGTIYDHVPDFEEEPLCSDTFSCVRREWLSLKTNLLQDVAYIPQYGFAPIWNIQLEYYPLKGHWTFGASLDIPWWQNRKVKHKFFQIRNWQLETRRYFGQESGSFRGWYAQAYLNAGKYGIGFTEKKGWQGEGWGGGLGAGYVWKLGKKRDAVRLPNGHLWTDRHHWRLEAGIQVGYFQTRYDPYVWGDPVNGSIDGLYYYDWKGLSTDFRKRQYRFTWLGPTRVGLTLTYDIFYRKMKKKGDVR